MQIDKQADRQTYIWKNNRIEEHMEGKADNQRLIHLLSNFQVVLLVTLKEELLMIQPPAQNATKREKQQKHPV